MKNDHIKSHINEIIKREKAITAVLLQKFLHVSIEGKSFLRKVLP